MLRCALFSLCVGTAFRIIRKPRSCSAQGIGAGPILIAGCGGKLNASFSKKARGAGYNIRLILVCICVFGSRSEAQTCVTYRSRRFTAAEVEMIGRLPHTLPYRFGPILFREP